MHDRGEQATPDIVLIVSESHCVNVCFLSSSAKVPIPRLLLRSIRITRNAIFTWYPGPWISFCLIKRRRSRRSLLPLFCDIKYRRNILRRLIYYFLGALNLYPRQRGYMIVYLGYQEREGRFNSAGCGIMLYSSLS